MKVYKSLNPCPIVDALIEIRFDSGFPPDAIFGMVFKTLAGKYPNRDELPILQLPSHIRNNDPNLKNAPFYRFYNEDFTIQIGPRVLTVSSYPNYAGWKSFSAEIKTCIDDIRELDLIKQVERFAIRYINAFEFNIFDYSNLKIDLTDSPLTKQNTYLKTSFEEEGFLSLLQMGEQVTIKKKNREPFLGSVLDIDTSTEDKNFLASFLEAPMATIEKAHQINKELFFAILNERIMDKINCEED